MRKFLLASAGVLALGAVAASAADLPRHREMPAKAPAYIAPPYNWTGFYVGINGGGGFGRSDFSAHGHPPVRSIPRAGSSAARSATIIRSASSCFGVEGDFDWSDIRGSTTLRRPELRNPQQLARAPRAAVSATPSTASCLTSPAAPPSATSRPRSAASATASTKDRLDRRRRPRSGNRRTVDRQDRISPRRSRRRSDRPCSARTSSFQQRYRARRHQLPVLTADLRDAAQSKAPEFAPGLSLGARRQTP